MFGIEFTKLSDKITCNELMNKKEKNLEGDCQFSLLADSFITGVATQEEPITSKIVGYLYRILKWKGLELYKWMGLSREV